MSHDTELIPHPGGLWEPHCTTCNWRPKEFCKNQDDADREARQHVLDVVRGVNQIAARSPGMGQSIRHARDMATRETTPPGEATEWNRLADEMERHLKVNSRTKAHEILDGQEALFDEGATP